MLQLIPFGGAIVAERYVYIPYIGLFLLIGLFYCYVSDNLYPHASKIKKPLIYCLISFGFILAIITFNRIVVWKDAVTLFTDVIEKNPDRDFGYEYRGVAKALSGDFKGCIADQTTALEINPKYPEAYYSRGLAKMNMNDNKGGFMDFQKAVEYKPDYFDAYNNMGTTMIKYKQFEKALGYFDQAIKYNAAYNIAYYNKGVCYYYLKNMSQACKFWQKASSMGYVKAGEMMRKFCK